MKIDDIKDHYKFFVRKLIDEHDNEVYTLNEILLLCEKRGCRTNYDGARRTLLQYARRAKWGNEVFWGNAVAIAEFKKTLGLK